MKYIYQNPDWHNFMWHGEKIQKLLRDIKKAQKILAENAVLKLAPNGKELFGKSWG